MAAFFFTFTMYRFRIKGDIFNVKILHQSIITFDSVKTLWCFYDGSVLLCIAIQNIENYGM